MQTSSLDLQTRQNPGRICSILDRQIQVTILGELSPSLAALRDTNITKPLPWFVLLTIPAADPRTVMLSFELFVKGES